MTLMKKENKKCSCWHKEQYWAGWETNIMGNSEPIIKEKYVCWGTPEKDVCSCGGDPIKCDFYPENRQKVQNQIQTELDKLELEFYRYYILKNDLQYDAMNEYEKWKKNKKCTKCTFKSDNPCAICIKAMDELHFEKDGKI